MLRESVIQYPTFAARLGQKSVQKGTLPCCSLAEVVSDATPRRETPDKERDSTEQEKWRGQGLEDLHPLYAEQNDHDLYDPEDEEGYERVPWNMGPPAPDGGRKGVEGRPAEPGLYAEPAAGHQRPGHRREVRPSHPEGGADEDGEGDPVLGTRVGVQEHRDQDDQVPKGDGEERLPPVHPGRHQA